MGKTPESFLLEKDRAAWDLLLPALQNGDDVTARRLAAEGATIEEKYLQLVLMLEEAARRRLADSGNLKPLDLKTLAATLVQTLALRRACTTADRSGKDPLEDALRASRVEFDEPDSLEAPQVPPKPT